MVRETYLRTISSGLKTPQQLPLQRKEKNQIIKKSTKVKGSYHIKMII